MRCSVWLMPEDPVPWAAEIADLSARLRGPLFPPHLTLVGGLELAEGEACEHLRAAASAIPPLALEPLAIGHGLTHHQCVFALVRPSPALVGARRVAAARFAREEPTFMPHLSLFYGALDDAAHAAVDRDLAGRRLPPLRVRSLHLWATGGDEAGWREVAVEPLGGR